MSECDRCVWGCAGKEEIFMTHKPNDVEETFSHSSIYQVIMNRWKGTNANARTLGKKGETERWRDGMWWRGWKRERECTVIAVMNGSGGRSPVAISQSLRQILGPELHYHDLATYAVFPEKKQCQTPVKRTINLEHFEGFSFEPCHRFWFEIESNY